MAVTMHDISTTVRLNQEVPLIIGQLLGVTPVAIGANPAQWRLSLECKVSKYHCRVEQKSPDHPKNVELGNWLDTNPRGVIGSDGDALSDASSAPQSASLGSDSFYDGHG